ncbi:unnamed protein product [Brassica rapa]|nr:unnamed protein product [Brassica napus]CAG7872972.1 unnamed protein product [Brassica rapa]CDY17666.1 BnaA06g34850D [Brassica napus]VDC68770.1 unnamed protein product [Brassica rapa]
MRRSIPSFVFPGGVRPLRNLKRTRHSKRSSEQIVSSTGSSSSTITSCESKVSAHVENSEDGSPSSSAGSICSAPKKDCCTKGAGESHHPVDKIATPQASHSQESEEVEDNFGLGKQVVKQIPSKYAISATTSSKDAFSNGAVEELENVPMHQPVVTHKASVQQLKPIIRLNFTSISTISVKNLRA